MSIGQVESEPSSVLTVLRRLGPLSDLRCCYEAGPTGFGLHRYLTEAGVSCIVVAPSTVPVRSNRIKTDRRDACSLAHFLRSGDVRPVAVPDEQTEAIRDLERARDDARLAERVVRQQLLKFLDRHGRKFTDGKVHWSKTHWEWIRRQKFAHEGQQRVLLDAIQSTEQAAARIVRLNQDISDCIATWSLHPLVMNLQAFRGVCELTAVGLAAEIGDFERFPTASSFMSFVGLVPSESSSGTTRRQGGITKTGNRHVRRLLIEAAWHYYGHRGTVSEKVRRRRINLPPEIIEIAERAQRRLRRKFYRMQQHQKSPARIVTALARELAGFIWAAARASGTPQPHKATTTQSPKADCKLARKNRKQRRAPVAATSKT